MRVLFVTRHSGAVEWAKRHGYSEAEVVGHLTEDLLAAVGRGDVVIGTLPINLVADLNAVGAVYRHLVLELPAEMRGREVSADDMERFGARLETYRAERL